MKFYHDIIILKWFKERWWLPPIFLIINSGHNNNGYFERFELFKTSISVISFDNQHILMLKVIRVTRWLGLSNLISCIIYILLSILTCWGIIVVYSLIRSWKIKLNLPLYLFRMFRRHSVIVVTMNYFRLFKLLFW